MTDLSQVSTQDLQNYQIGNYSAISDSGLQALNQISPDLHPQSANSAMPLPQAAVREAGIFGRAVGPTLAGAGAGAAIGAMGGPAAPITVPAGAIIGGIVGSMPGGVMDTGVNYLADKMGAAKPETDTEKTMSAVDQGVAGALTGIGSGSAINGAVAAGKDLPEIAPYLGKLLADKPVAQLAGAAGAGSMSSIAGQNGAGPATQMAAGVLGGIAGHNAVSIPSGVIGSGRTILNPGASIDRATGQLLYNQSTDPYASASSMRSSPVYVPGSNPTAAQASLDPGIVALQKGVQNTPQYGPTFTGLANDQNTARQAAFTQLAGTPKTLQDLQDARDAVTGPLREDAFNLNNQPVGSTRRAFSFQADPTTQVNVNPVQAKINAIAGTPQINNPDVGTVLGAASSAVSNGKNLYDPAFAYELKKGMQTNAENLLNASKGGVDISNPDSSQRLAGGTLSGVNKVLDAQINQATGGKYQPYLDAYSSMSKPIDQSSLLQKLQQGASSQGMDVNGNRMLTQSGLGSQMQRNAQAIQETLTPEQQVGLESIKSDLDRAQTASNIPGQAVGSDTIRNQMMAEMLGKFSTLPDNKALGLIPGGKLVAGLANKGIDAVYAKPALARLASALQDPNDAASLMQNASSNQQQIKNSMMANMLYGNLTQPMLSTMGSRQ